MNNAFTILQNWKNVGRYEGQVNAAGKPHGKGIVRYDDRSKPRGGVIFEGEYQNGTRHGRGCMLFRNGDTFEGEWREGRQHYGTYFWRASGSCYVGHVKNGFFEDEEGWVFYPKDGGYDVGTWKAGKMEGWATYVRKDGYSRCELVAGSRQGRITTFWWNGGVFEATYVDDMRLGPASFLWPNGDQWTGNFSSNTRGYGIKTEEATGQATPGTFTLTADEEWNWFIVFTPDD